jgi:ribonuclease D
VDPLAGLDLAPLGALLADPARETVLHAAENDVIQLRHQFGWSVGRLYDTQVACFVLGIKPYSLAGILEARFGVVLDKGLQRSDWARRPLDPAQTAYAVEDTCHLLDLARELQAKAREAGREEEIALECRRIAERDWEPEPFDPEAFRKMEGARDLAPASLRLLRDLYLLRNEEAERRNRAPYRVAADGALVALARALGRRPEKGVPEAFWQRYGRRVGKLAEQARRQGPLPPPRRRKRGEAGEPAPADVKAVFERLRRWRARAALERGVETWVVARNELLLKVALARVATLADLEPLLEPFRFREYGAAILAAVLDSASDAAENAEGGEL